MSWTMVFFRRSVYGGDGPEGVHKLHQPHREVHIQIPGSRGLTRLGRMQAGLGPPHEVLHQGMDDLGEVFAGVVNLIPLSRRCLTFVLDTNPLSKTNRASSFPYLLMLETILSTGDPLVRVFRERAGTGLLRLRRGSPRPGRLCAGDPRPCASRKRPQMGLRGLSTRSSENADLPPRAEIVTKSIMASEIIHNMGYIITIIFFTTTTRQLSVPLLLWIRNIQSEPQ